MQGARIRYTPTTAPEMGTETKRNMEVLLEADPAKSAGQGFGSAGQYLDVCIKTDTDTLDGYGLRIIRTAAHSDAVSMYLIQYVRGQAQCISREVVTNCFVTGCRIWVRYENGILSAKAWTVTEPTAGKGLCPGSGAYGRSRQKRKCRKHRTTDLAHRIVGNGELEKYHDVTWRKHSLFLKISDKMW